MKTSCIEHPSKERMLVIRQWQIIACDGNRCAAALLSFFEYSHNWKVEQAEKARELNRYAEQMGVATRHDESLVQWHNEKQLEEGILRQYECKAIARALKLLEEKGFVERAPHTYIRANGLPDRTRHFLLRPDVINEWLKCHYPKLENGLNAILLNRRTRAPKKENKYSQIGAQTIVNNQSKQSIVNERVHDEKSLAPKAENPQPQNLDPRRPFDIGNSQDERYSSPHFLALLEVCQLKLKTLMPTKRARYAGIAVTLSEDYTPEQMRQARERWPFPTAPTPEQFAEQIDKYLNAKEQPNGKQSRDTRNEQERRDAFIAQVERDAAAQRSGESGTPDSDLRCADEDGSSLPAHNGYHARSGGTGMDRCFVSPQRAGGESWKVI